VAASNRQLKLYVIHLLSCKDTADAAPSILHCQEKMSFISKYEIIFPQKVYTKINVIEKLFMLLQTFEINIAFGYEVQTAKNGIISRDIF
jgi:hypothetical protein